MCGFVGWLDKAPADRSVLERMTTTLAHRGPDAAGYHLQGPIGLGHRRLRGRRTDHYHQAEHQGDQDLHGS